mgnify:CR=1 FL=1
MEIHAKYKIPVFWDDEFKHLHYVKEDFNDPESVDRWIRLGYANNFVGNMCDMRGDQPSWNHRFISIYQEMGWKNIGTSYYRMSTGTVLPTHRDLYSKYIKIHQLQGQEHSIRRAIVFLEDWEPGQYSETDGIGLVNWSAGTTIEWAYDTPHAAANLGLKPRYTLQITGHI